MGVLWYGSTYLDIEVFNKCDVLIQQCIKRGLYSTLYCSTLSNSIHYRMVLANAVLCIYSTYMYCHGIHSSFFRKAVHIKTKRYETFYLTLWSILQTKKWTNQLIFSNISSAGSTGSIGLENIRLTITMCSVFITTPC